MRLEEPEIHPKLMGTEQTYCGRVPDWTVEPSQDPEHIVMRHEPHDQPVLVRFALDRVGWFELIGPDPEHASGGGDGCLLIDRDDLEWLRDVAIPAALAATPGSPRGVAP